MTDNTLLKLLFTGILLAMMAVTAWASLHQDVQHWGGLTRAPDRYWTIATLLGAYCGFVTFYARSRCFDAADCAQLKIGYFP